MSWAGFAILLAALLLATADWFTRPPPLPSYTEVRAAYRPSEAWLHDRDGRLIDSSRVDFAVRRLAWTPLERIAPPVRETLIAAEDRRFGSHGGVDWLALMGATRDRATGKRMRGASTLTMQLAAFLAPDLARPGARGLRHKLRQMRAAWALEDRWSKDQLLEAYLNLAGFRGEAAGIGAAALGLFGKAPDALTAEDAALLAALLPNPAADAASLSERACHLLSRSSRAKSRDLFERSENFATSEPRSARSGPSTSARSAEGYPERLPWQAAEGLGTNGCDLTGQAASMLGPTRSLALDPGLAPHLAAKLLDAPGKRVTSTLDARVQAVAATALRRQLQGLGGSRARDGAVIVVDNETGDVLAYVGGVRGASTAPEVDGAASYRQAGSTLKPFLYAQAIERGYLTPASILDDSPVQLDTASGLYVPQNYDRAFKGPVSARVALAGSLNVPAVRTLLLTGVEAFRDRLWDTGYRGLVEDGQYYGFSLALGSAEVTLLEQVAAYRSLANGGRWSPLRLTTDAPPIRSRAVTSPRAAWLIADMLADPAARAGSFGMDSALRLPFWAAAKTGTSKGMRDNWCIGFTPRHTVGVWVGNLEGDPMRAVSGTSGAAPVWRDVMLALGDGGRPRAPAGIEARAVRFADGNEQPRREWFLAGTSQAELAAAPEGARRPRITSPVSGSVYALDPDIPGPRQRLALSVSGPTAGHRLMLDRRTLGPADASLAILAPPGPHLLRLVDSGGRVVDQVRFTMR